MKKEANYMIKIFSVEEGSKRLLFCSNLRDMIRSGLHDPDDVAKKLGVSPRTIYNYTRGRTYPSEERIQQLADVLGCTVDDLYDDTNAPWKFGSDE